MPETSEQVESITVRQELTSKPKSEKVVDRVLISDRKLVLIILAVAFVIFVMAKRELIAKSIVDKMLGQYQSLCPGLETNLKINMAFVDGEILIDDGRKKAYESGQKSVRTFGRNIFERVGPDYREYREPTAKDLWRRQWAEKVSAYFVRSGIHHERVLPNRLSCTTSRQQLAIRTENQ